MERKRNRGAGDSLRADSPLSHARERRRAKPAGGKESGEEARRQCHFLVSRPRHTISLRHALLCSNVSLLVG